MDLIHLCDTLSPVENGVAIYRIKFTVPVIVRAKLSDPSNPKGVEICSGR